MVPLSLVALLFAASPSPQAVEKAAAEVLTSGDYQRELPTGSVSKPVRPLSIPIGPMAQVSLLVLRMIGVVLAALLIVWLVRMIRRHVRDSTGPDSAATTARSITEAPLAAAEALAAQGRFAEAVHVLLLRTLEVLSQSLSGRLSPAFTSREVLSEIPLRDAGRDALAGLVSAVELCHFGGSDATESDYRICLDRFRRFAAAYEAGV
jgi:hypothetical protein